MQARTTKVLRDLPAARRLVEELRAQGKRIVFTNGAFDLFHVGHLRALREARSLGDHLMVGVNSDRSVKRQKGDPRPIFPQEERLEILEGLECVDSLLLFDFATVDPLLEALQPDIHAKGTDYTIETVPERETVLKYGGRIAIVGDAKAHSTTEIIDKLRIIGN